MRLSRFTWRVLLAAACFGALLSNSVAKADHGTCPYVAAQNQVCPLSQDHCDEYLYGYELADVPASPTAAMQDQEQDFVSDCPYRSIHDAIYDAEVYGLAGKVDRSADECIETITVFHTKGSQSVEIVTGDAEPTAVAEEVGQTTDGDDYYYDSEADLYDSETYEYEAYEYDAYDEYDYDQYYYDNYEGDPVEAQSSNVVESEAILMPPAVDDEPIEDGPMPYDEYGYDEYSMDETDGVADDDQYADYWNDVEVTGEAPDSDLWGEAEMNRDATADLQCEEYSYEDDLECEYDNGAGELTAIQPSVTEAADRTIDSQPIAQALGALGIFPFAEGILGDISLEQLAAKLPKAAGNVANTVESAPCEDECGWEDWHCYYEFQQEQPVQEVVEVEPGNSLLQLERSALRILATSIDHAGRTLQIISDDLMRISESEVADSGSVQRLK